MANSYKIARPKIPVSLTHGGSATTASVATAQNGILQEVLILAPATVDGSATLTVEIIDSDSVVIYSKSGVAAAAKSVNLLAADAKVPLGGTQTVKVTFSAAQTATDTITNVVLLVER